MQLLRQLRARLPAARVDMLLPLARRLQSGGHDVVFAIKDVTRAGARLEVENFRYVQAPLWLGPPLRRPPAASFGELLARFGYHDTPGLVSVVRAWRHTIDLVAPDAILANHAPTALLAARGLSVPRMALGTGFECPPPGVPSLALLASGQYPAERPRQADRDVVAAVNAALTRLGLARIRHVTDVFEADAQCLCTVAELDVFHPARDGAGYLGPIMNLDQRVRANWPAAGDGRVFAYLNPAAPAAGLFAPNARHRRLVVPSPTPAPARNGAEPQATPTRAQMTRAQRLRRVFEASASCSRPWPTSM